VCHVNIFIQLLQKAGVKVHLLSYGEGDVLCGLTRERV
jgi:hypothetical protein